MNKIDILVEGYARENADGGYDASPTTTLINAVNTKIIVDPGANPDLLSKALTQRNLQVSDVDIVFLTHYHPDHTLNIRLFPNHPIYDGDTIYVGDVETPYEGVIPGTDIRVLKTPGHAHEHASLVVNVGELVYVVAADVFWWMDGEQKSDTSDDLLNLSDPFVKDVDALRASRVKILEIADYIIPGHGVIFKNPARG